MIIDRTIIHELQQVADITINDTEQCKEIILNNPYNICSLINGSSPLELDTEDMIHRRTAMAFNYLIIENFDSLEEFYATIGVNKPWMDRLWTGRIDRLNPKHIKNIIDIWKINPMYIMDEDDDILFT